MEPVDKKEAETSLEGVGKAEGGPKPAEEFTKQRDEKDDSSISLNTSGKSVSVTQEDQGNSKVPADAIVPSLAVEKESKVGDDASAVGDIKSLSAEAEEKVEAVVKPSALSGSVEKGKDAAETHAETSNKLPAAISKTAASLKARAVITKKLPATSSIKKNVNPVSSKALRLKGVKKKVLSSSKAGVGKDGQDTKESTSEGKNLPGNLSEVKAIEGKEPVTGHKAKQSNSSVKEFHESIKSINKQNSGQASKNKKMKLQGRENLRSSENAVNPVRKGEVNDTEEKRMENSNKKEKLGGLIFMCNSKTKPDCITYRVMGVNMGKKDLVMAIQPGLKLFLYDYDLKLMYGIFKASSGGGIKLEPRAFNGAFPVQVRFNVQAECHPLPEVVFKKAMLENFTCKHKFRTELSPKQVRKLSKLFQPVALGVAPKTQAEEVHDRSARRKRTQEEYSLARERAPRHQRHKKSRRDSHVDREGRRHEVQVYGRDHRDLSPLQRVDIPRETFLTETDYRAYGLQGERRNLTITANVDPLLPSHKAYYAEDHLARQADEFRRNAVTGHRDYVLSSHRYLDDVDYRTYSRDTRPELSHATGGRSIGSAHHFYPEDQYITYRHGTSSLFSYAEHPRREEIPLSSLHGYDRAQAYGYETDHVRRMEDVPTGLRPVIYTADTLAEYDRAIHYRIPVADATHVPVSARYSFAGPRI